MHLLTMTNRRRRRYHLLVALLAAVFLPELRGATVGHADSVVVTDTYTSTVAGAAQVPVSHFPSGTQIVYFDYTVATPSASDVGIVNVDIGNTTGPFLAAAPLDFRTAGSKYVALSTPSGIFPDGGYCVILKVNGVPQSIANNVPYAFTVGVVPYAFTCPNPPPDVSTPTATATVPPSATPTGAPATPTATRPPPTASPTSTSPNTSTPTPTATPTPTSPPAPKATATPRPTPTPAPTQPIEESLHNFVVAITSGLRPRHFGTLRLYVHGTHGRPVSGTRIVVDARRLGMARLRQGNTNAYGIVTFANLWPPHGGVLAITASKPGYASVTVELSV